MQVHSLNLQMQHFRKLQTLMYEGHLDEAEHQSGSLPKSKKRRGPHVQNRMVSRTPVNVQATSISTRPNIDMWEPSKVEKKAWEPSKVEKKAPTCKTEWCPELLSGPERAGHLDEAEHRRGSLPKSKKRRASLPKSKNAPQKCFL